MHDALTLQADDRPFFMHLDAHLRMHSKLFSHRHLTRVLGTQERRIEATSGDDEYETQRLVIFERLEGYVSLPEIFGVQ